MHTSITCLTASALLLLTACGGSSSTTPTSPADGGDSGNPGNMPDGGGGGGDTDNPSGTILFIGNIDVSDDSSGNNVELVGGFLRLGNSIALATAEQELGPLNDAPDTCEFTVSETLIPDTGGDDFDFDIDIPDFSFSFVSAGEIIPFTSSSGTFAELERTVIPIANFTLYVLAGDPTPESIPGPVPSGLTFNIPGDVFPAFANVPVPNVDSLVLTTPALGAVVSSDTVFTWEATPGSEAVISIQGSGFQFDVENPTSVGFTNLSCEVVDDGSFTIPAATQAELDAAGSNLTFNQMTRTFSSLQQSDNAALIVSRTSEL